MKAARLAVAVAIILGSAARLHAQTAPNFENGWKPYGSYDGSHLDTVNLMNGNLMLHAPLLPGIPQRGAASLQETLYVTSKNWQTVCKPLPSGVTACSWQNGGTGVNILLSPALTVHRTLNKQYSGGQGITTYVAYGYSIVGADASSHQMHGVTGSEDSNGAPTKFDSMDLTGYHMEMSNPDSNGIMNTFTITDRQGNQYQGIISQTQPCERAQDNGIHAPGSYQPMTDDSPMGDQYCSQTGYATSFVDSNGNQMNLRGHESTTLDTMGRPAPLFVSGPAWDPTDSSGCSLAHPFVSSTVFYYNAPDGSLRSIKQCVSQINIQTAFNQTWGGGPIAEFSSSSLTYPGSTAITTIILGDGTKWSFDYDTYGELASVGLPTGGSITYGWTTIDFPNCNPNSASAVSRAVATRTLNDGQGHSYTWNYSWGTLANGSITNRVTDPLLNDTVHTFTTQLPPGSPNIPGCNLYETATIEYQGAQSANHPLQRSDTTFTSTYLAEDTFGAGGGVGNVFATDVVTTVYPSGKVKKVHKDPDSGLGAGKPIFGNVKKELEYDWGQGASGALLRETDTTYQCEINSAYLTAHLLDLPASVVVKDAGGNRAAETDYTYDEPAYLITPTPAVTTQHNSTPPNGVRGNQTTVGRWLNTTNSFIASHTKWYDTGEVYQTIDPLGHTTTHSYDPFYVGAYSTQTCAPTTNNVTHCVSGTYDFTTGVLTSLTNENATSQASGNTPGDSAHTSTYAYDYLFRITSAQAPPDPANNSLRATTSFNFSAPNAFPVTVQRSKSVTTALSDSATSFFDGLGRGYKSQHALPNGTATVDTTFDLAGHAATVSNPYFTTSDPTYGTTTNAYDGLDRVTQTTKQDGSISRVAYNVVTAVAVPGDCTQTTDEAGKQRRACVDGLGRLVEVDETGDTFAGSQAGGSFTVSGTLQSGSRATGSVTIQGAEQSKPVAGGIGGGCDPGMICDGGGGGTASNLYDTGTVTITVNGHSYAYIFNGSDTSTDTTSTVALGLAAAINADSSAVVTATVSGTIVNLTAKAPGPGGNVSLASSYTWDTADFAGPSFTTVNSGAALTGGSNSGGVYDAGTMTVVIGTFSASVPYGSTGNSTSAQVASALAAALSASNSPVTASASGSTVSLTYKTIGTAGNVTVSCSSATSQGAYFLGPSFTCPASTGLSNGFNPQSPSLDHAFYATLYFYDALGNLVCVEQHGNVAGTGCNANPSNDASSPWRVRRFTYDSFSRLLTAKNPESGTITYTYDADGQLLQKTSPAPNQTGTATQTVSYCYDELHRVTGKGYGAQSCPLATPVVSYAYDSGSNAKGKLTSLTDQAGTATYGFDILGRMNSETRPIAGISKSTSYTYNLDGSVKTLTYPSGRVVTYTPDSAGRLVSAVDGNGTNYVTSASYNPDSSLKSLLNGSTPALNQNFQYTPRLQLCRITTLTSGTLPTSCTDSQNIGNIMDRGYDFHAGNGTAGSGADNGNVFAITNYRDSNRSQAFTYDALNRLTSGWSSANTGTYSWGENYSIDAWGNLQISPMVTKAHGGSFQLSGNAQNRPTGMAYDAAGNLMSYVSATYTYDQENRLLSTAGMTYTYDGNGERVMKSNTSTGAPVKRFWSMGGNTLAEGDGTGNLTAEYIHFGGKRVARIDLLANTVHYYLSDHLGSTSIVASAAGAIEEESDYYPFGTEIAVTGGINELKFTGKRRDAESQLDYFGARYFDNPYGRFMTPDPLMASGHASNPQSWNRYAYALNNPLRYVDPDGMEVPSGCAKDKKCTIVVKVNVVWDKTANKGKGLTDKQKQDFQKNQIDKAIKDYAKSNIKLDVTYTEGSFTVDSDNHPNFIGIQSDAVNIVASNQTLDGSNESYMTKSGIAITLVNVNSVHDNDAFPLFTNTTEHELAHQFLGHTSEPPPGFIGTQVKEYSVDSRVQGQHIGISQQGFREGLEPRRYATPTNPEAIKPQ